MITAHLRPITVCRLIAIVAISLGLAPVSAQQERGRTPAPRSNSVDLTARDRDLRDRSMAMDRIGKEQQAKSELVERLKTDFRRLQTVNNDLMRDVSNTLNLDYSRIADAVAQMNQCAKRLKVNIAVLAASGNDPKMEDAANDEQLRRSLRMLDDTVSSFIDSMSVVEAKKTDKAASELNSVIRLSDSVKRSARKLDKLAQKR
jgi:hypothetical protein